MRGAIRPLLIWLGAVAGMAIGLSIDCRSISPAALASLCASGDGPLVLIRHLAALPATNIGMALGMLTPSALATRLNFGAVCRGLACYVLMLAGMSFGGCIGVALAGEASLDWSAPLMVAAMTLGMTGAMVVAGPLSCSEEKPGRFQMQRLASGGKPLKFTAE